MSNQSMSRGNSSMGHITPTFGHGPTLPGGGGYMPNLGGPPLSPNRGMQIMPGIGGQVPMSRPPPFMMRHQDRRPMGGMGVLMGGRVPGPGLVGYPGSNDHHPPILDPSEFPSLTSRNLAQGDAYHQSLPAKPYVGMVKQPQTETTAFTMTSEDFPALPGTVPPPPPVNEASGKATPSNVLQPSEPTDQRNIAQERSPIKQGIITSSDGKVTNIPGSMVDDQYGMVGLLTFIRVAETDPNLVSLALGFDLTALGLNLNATDSLYPSFGGPWAEGPVRAEDIDFTVPQEYNISDQIRGQDFVTSIREKLAPLKMNRYKDELLFYLFYTYTGDALQILAAGELFNRDWRYHKDEKIWICRAPGIQAVEKGNNYERGTYYFFDPISWRKVAKEFFLEYDKLEDRPIVPPSLVHSYLAA